MKLNRRNLVLGVALAATLAAVSLVGADDGESEVVGAAAPEGHRQAGGRRQAEGPKKPTLDLAVLDRRGLAESKVDLFAAHSWYVPPPPPPPPKPTAPALPFKFLGRIIEADETAVFVSDGQRNRTVRAGDVIDNVWRVDAIEALRIRFTYLPLDQEKTLVLGAAR